MKKAKGVVWTVVRIGIGVGLIVFLIKSGKLNLTELKGVRDRPLQMAGTAAVFLVCLLLAAIRWGILLRAQGISISMLAVLRLSFIGNFFNIIMPGGVGGDVFKAYYVAKGRDQKAAAVTTVLVDRIIGLVAISGLAFFAICANFQFLWQPGQDGTPELMQRRNLVVGVGAAFLCVLLGFTILMSRWVRQIPLFARLIERLPFHETINRVYDAFHRYHESRWAIVVAFLLSFVTHSFSTLGCFLFGQALGQQDITLANTLFLVPLGLCVNAIPIAPMGLGVAEWGFGKLYGMLAPVGVSLDQWNKGEEVAGLMHAAVIIWSLLGGIFYMQGRKAYDATMSAAQEEQAGTT